MLTRPQALLKNYSTFTPIDVDYVNAVTAYRWESGKPKGFWQRTKERLKPSKISLDLGKIIAPVLKASGIDIALSDIASIEWNKEAQDKLSSGIDLDHATASTQFSRVLEIQKKCIENSYRHNLQYPQTLSKEEAWLLESPGLKPSSFIGEPLAHGETFVVDAMLVVGGDSGEQRHFFLADYPPFLSKKTDSNIKLRLSDSVLQRLYKHPGLVLGWHPYCRVLGRYSSLGEIEPVVEPLLISLRSVNSVSDAIVKSLGGEWESLADEVNSQGVLRNMAHDEVKFDLRVQRTLLKDKLPDDATDEMVVREAWHDIKEKLNIEIEKVRAFEDNIFSGPMAFLLGLYHFLRSDGGEKYRLIGRDVAHQLDSAVSFWLGTETLDLGIDEKDKRSPGLRWRQDSLIFKPYDVIRFAEPQLDELLSVCTERPS